MSRPANPPLSRRERRAQQRFERPPRPKARRTAPRPRWQSPMVLVSAGALLVGGVLVFLALPRDPGGGEELFQPPTGYTAELADGDVLGSGEAPVVIELYADFQCPACRLFVTGRWRVLFRSSSCRGPCGSRRWTSTSWVAAARASRSSSLRAPRCAAEQDRYWQFHDLVFWNQGRENRGDHDAVFIGRVADAAELDRTAFDACFGREDIRAADSGADGRRHGSGHHLHPDTPRQWTAGGRRPGLRAACGHDPAAGG